MKPLSPRLYEPSVRRSRSIRHTHAVEAPPRIEPAAFSAVPRQRRACDAHASSHVAVRESSADSDDANLRAYARERRRRRNAIKDPEARHRLSFSAVRVLVGQRVDRALGDRRGADGDAERRSAMQATSAVELIAGVEPAGTAGVDESRCRR